MNLLILMQVYGYDAIYMNIWCILAL
jgi:hypothetical protein